MVSSRAAPAAARTASGQNLDRIAVLGGGAWGTALAAATVRAGRRVMLWARCDETVREINAERLNRRHLGQAPLPEGLRATACMAEAAAGAEAVLLAVPSPAVRAVMRELQAVSPPAVPVVLCAKGIERGTGLLMSRVVADEAPGRPVAVLSGPSFAEEVVRGLPTALTIASPCAAGEDPGTSLAARLALALGSGSFRPYISDDMTGVEIGGTVKNVIAIACGMAEGAGFGSNARAALITRGLDEIRRLAEALGGRRETVSGLSGVGDLVLTCSSTQSRNFSFGVQLGRGIPRRAVFDGRPVVVEGIGNAVAVTDLARGAEVDMPICEAVRRVVHEDQPFAAAFQDLWTRPLRAEPPSLDIRLAHPGSPRP